MPGESIPQGLWLPPRVATLLVAASDALDRTRAQADYLCDGVDDDVQINAALTALPAADGRVMLSEGTFNCIADIFVPDRTTLEGQGFNTILSFAGIGVVNAVILLGDEIHVKNLRILLDSLVGTAGARPNGIYGFNRNFCWLENLYITADVTDADDGSDIRQCGILLITGAFHKIINCKIDGARRHGIHLHGDGHEGGISGCLVEGCTCHQNGHWGILLYDGAQDCTIVGNYCDLNAFNVIGAVGGGGICVATLAGDPALQNHHTITGNNCSFNTHGSPGILLYNIIGCTVTGNTCYSNAGHGINLEEGVSDVIISGNECNDNDSADTATYDGINVGNICIAIDVVGNHCGGNHRYGIYSQGFNINIVGNYVYENDREGIYIVGPYTAIKTNYIYVNGKDAAGTYHGIYCSGTDCSIVANTVEDIDTWMDDGIHLPSGGDRVQINDNYIHDMTGDGIQLTANNDDCMIKNNYIYHCDGFGINIVAATCDRTIVENNKLLTNGAGAINDQGTDTILPEIIIDAPNPDANIGEFPAQQMLDDVDTEIRMKLHCPSDFQELVRAHIIFVSGATGDLVCDINTDFGKICASEVYNTHSDSDLNNIHGTIINQIGCFEFSAALDGIAASDWIGVRFTRLGTNAFDTIAANVYLLGIRMQYV